MNTKIVTTLTLALSITLTGSFLSSATQTANANTPNKISVTEAIPLADINGYFYNADGYLCFELSDTTRQFNDPTGYAYSKICSRLPYLKALEQTETYPTTAKVIKVKRKTDTVTVQDYSGHKWKFRGCEDYEKNDVVSMLMDSNGTKIVTDDIILQVRYSGAER